jgi:hypothetical protein
MIHTIARRLFSDSSYKSPAVCIKNSRKMERGRKSNKGCYRGRRFISWDFSPDELTRLHHVASILSEVEHLRALDRRHTIETYKAWRRRVYEPLLNKINRRMCDGDDRTIAQTLTPCQRSSALPSSCKVSTVSTDPSKERVNPQFYQRCKYEATIFGHQSRLENSSIQRKESRLPSTPLQDHYTFPRDCSSAAAEFPRGKRSFDLLPRFYRRNPLLLE